MTHLPFIAGAYGLAILVPVVFAATAMNRLRRAKARLAVLDTRRRG